MSSQTPIQALSQEDLAHIDVEIRLLEQKLREDGHLSREERKHLRALMRMKAHAEKTPRPTEVSLTRLDELPQALQDHMGTSRHGKSYVVPASFTSDFAVFQQLMESYGGRLVELIVSFDPSLANRRDVVEQMLALESAPAEPTGSPVVLFGRGPDVFGKR